MNNSAQPPSSDAFVRLVRSHIKQMSAAATDVVEALGLPAQAKADVITAVFASEAVTEAGTEQPTSALREQQLRALVHDYTLAILKRTAPKDVSSFERLWPALRSLSIAGLADDLARATPASAGLGISGPPRQLLSLVSTVSWAVSRSTKPTGLPLPGISAEALLQAARSRQCPPAIAQTLVGYLTR